MHGFPQHILQLMLYCRQLYDWFEKKNNVLCGSVILLKWNGQLEDCIVNVFIKVCDIQQNFQP